jgi:hypothetical protein
MRKLLLLPALLLSTPAYAADQGDVQKLAQYGQCILKYGGACPKAAVGFPIPLPPPQYAKPYTGLLSVVRMDDYSVLRSLCNSATAVACSIRSNTSCLILLGPNVHDNPQALQHELSHCVGWPANHPGAR